MEEWTTDQVRVLDNHGIMSNYSDSQLDCLESGIKEYFPQREQLVDRIYRVRQYRQVFRRREAEKQELYDQRHLNGSLQYLFFYWYAQIVCLFVFNDFTKSNEISQLERQQRLAGFTMCALTLISVLMEVTFYLILVFKRALRFELRNIENIFEKSKRFHLE